MNKEQIEKINLTILIVLPLLVLVLSWYFYGWQLAVILFLFMGWNDARITSDLDIFGRKVEKFVDKNKNS